MARSLDADGGSVGILFATCQSGGSCRTGVCHTCETTVLSGGLRYDPDPVEPPTDGSGLLCCSQPTEDVALDL